MRTSWLAAGLVIIVLTLWMLSGLFKSDESDTADTPQTDPLMAVEIKTVEIDKVAREIVLQGHLEPVQHLFLKAQTSGAVESVLVNKGDRINQGDPLLLLDQGGRQNTLAEAEARVKTAQSEQAAALSLRQQRLQSQLQLEQSEASLEAALSLGDDGELGVKAVDDDNRVLFLPIELLSTALDGAWVSGIPQGSRLITLGQGFVNVGEQVSPVDAEAQSDSLIEGNS